MFNIIHEAELGLAALENLAELIRFSMSTLFENLCRTILLGSLKASSANKKKKKNALPGSLIILHSS